MDINSIFEKIANGGDLDEVRNEIGNLVKEVLSDFGENLNNWQKSYIAMAIGNLACNIAQQNGTSDAWLRLCLLNVENSLIPEDQRDDNAIANTEELNNITYQQLLDAISSLL